MTKISAANEQIIIMNAHVSITWTGAILNYYNFLVHNHGKAATLSGCTEHKDGQK
jgi:hypothetical protein